MSDRKLLELAAKAYGVELDYRRSSDAYYYDDPETGREQWCPPDDDGQALRLAVKLGINIRFCQETDSVICSKDADGYQFEAVECMDEHGVRRAITMVAAEIGKRTGGAE